MSPPLVMLPGTLCDERLFAEVRTALAPTVTLVGLRPDAELVAIAAAGHRSTIDQPAACTELLAAWPEDSAAQSTQSTQTTMEGIIP